MADKKYTFPEGTTTISSKELNNAFSKYEVVEIPGTVGEVIAREERNVAKKSILKNLILNEGTVLLRAYIGKQATYNVPTTLLNIATNGIAPRVICLKNGFQVGNYCEFSEVEYLQTYTTADLRYNTFKELKHYVYLGETMKNWVHSPFEEVPEGCVIHVENQKVAKSVLKKCDVFKHYVVVDAAEWKDFPADKLAMTMEEYDPESRILPEQKKMREEEEQKRQEKLKKQQEEMRLRQKRDVIENMSETVIAPVMESLLGEMVTEKTAPGWMRRNYNVTAIEEDKSDASLIKIDVIVAKDLWNNMWDKSLWLEVTMEASEVTDKINVFAEHFKRLQAFIEDNRGLIEYRGLRIGSKLGTPNCPTPGISLPFQDTVVVGSFNPATIEKDVRKIKDFVDELEVHIEDGKKVFPKGFSITPRL